MFWVDTLVYITLVIVMNMPVINIVPYIFFFTPRPLAALSKSSICQFVNPTLHINNVSGTTLYFIWLIILPSAWILVQCHNCWCPSYLVDKIMSSPNIDGWRFLSSFRAIFMQPLCFSNEEGYKLSVYIFSKTIQHLNNQNWLHRVLH